MVIYRAYTGVEDVCLIRSMNDFIENIEDDKRQSRDSLNVFLSCIGIVNQWLGIPYTEKIVPMHNGSVSKHDRH